MLATISRKFCWSNEPNHKSIEINALSSWLRFCKLCIQSWLDNKKQCKPIYDKWFIIVWHCLTLRVKSILNQRKLIKTLILLCQVSIRSSSYMRKWPLVINYQLTNNSFIRISVLLLMPARPHVITSLIILSGFPKHFNKCSWIISWKWHELN